MYLFMLLALLGQQQGAAQAGFPGTPANLRPKVEIAWNRLYDAHEIYAHMDRLEAQWPELLTHVVIGHSVENREMRVYTLNDPASGPADTKPAMWVDGNVHGNEVQGAEAVVYLTWYLLENKDTPRVKALLDRAAFYLLPMQNPDGRASWFQRANTASSSRSGVQPLDSDGDGLFDEDPPNDLDGDGQIVQMRKYLPGEGNFRLNADDPRIMERVPDNDRGIRGDWVMVGQEGIDDDGDGRINEDPIGGYDMNRSWPSMWQPKHVQGGADPYPLYWPETRAIARFLVERPNLAALQSFHNSGGMILRGPGAESFGEYPARDLRAFDEIGRDGEKMLPFYRYMIIWRDLYTVFGGFATWGYEGLGVISFTNEMWADERKYPDAGGDPGQQGELFFDDTLLVGEGFVDWHPYEHPFYGPVELGGFKKDVGRVPPTFLIEEELHRNALFCVKHAECMPLVVVAKVEQSELGGGVKAIDVELRNERLIPTRTAYASQKQIGSPDLIMIEGEGIEVLAGGFRTDRFRPEEVRLAEREPARLVSENGIGGRESVRVRWFVRGSGSARVIFQAEKARKVEHAFTVD